MKKIAKNIFYFFYNKIGNLYIRLLFVKPIFNLLYNQERLASKRLLENFNNNKIKNLVNELKSNGIAFIEFNELFENLKFSEFKEWGLSVIENKIDHSKGRKDYLDYYLDYDKISDYSILQKILKEDNLYYIISSYLLNTQPKLNYFRIWKNNITNEKPKDSQLWHRDGDNLIICKCFIYLEDIDESNGATEYIKESNYFGKLYTRKKSKAPESHYIDTLPDEFRENKIIAKGKAGTVMLVDTSGFHKGGRCSVRDRKLFTSTFSLTHSFNKIKRKTPSYFDDPIISSLIR